MTKWRNAKLVAIYDRRLRIRLRRLRNSDQGPRISWEEFIKSTCEHAFKVDPWEEFIKSICEHGFKVAPVK